MAKLTSTNTDFLIGKRAYQWREYDKAKQYLGKAAAAGDADAMALLGQRLHEEGNLAEAEQWLGKAAAAGFTDAVPLLGLTVHEQGRSAEAEQMLRKAAAIGHPKSMLALGTMLRDQGRKAEAWQWVRKAAAAGVLGLRPTMRHKGSGMHQTWFMGWRWEAGGGSARQQVTEMGEKAAEIGDEIGREHGDHGQH
jgi:TPR repeat protein